MNREKIGEALGDVGNLILTFNDNTADGGAVCFHLVAISRIIATKYLSKNDPARDVLDQQFITLIKTLNAETRMTVLRMAASNKADELAKKLLGEQN